MSVVLYQNKKKPWKFIVITKSNYERSFFFRISRVPNNHWLMRPRFFAHINLFFISFWRDNSNFKIGIGFGKKHISLLFHS